MTRPNGVAVRSPVRLPRRALDYAQSGSGRRCQRSWVGEESRRVQVRRRTTAAAPGRDTRSRLQVSSRAGRGRSARRPKTRSPPAAVVAVEQLAAIGGPPPRAAPFARTRSCGRYYTSGSAALPRLVGTQICTLDLEGRIEIRPVCPAGTPAAACDVLDLPPTAWRCGRACPTRYRGAPQERSGSERRRAHRGDSRRMSPLAGSDYQPRRSPYRRLRSARLLLAPSFLLRNCTAAAAAPRAPRERRAPVGRPAGRSSAVVDRRCRAEAVGVAHTAGRARLRDASRSRRAA